MKAALGLFASTVALFFCFVLFLPLFSLFAATVFYSLRFLHLPSPFFAS